ncbi:MAG: glycine betaine ABC transporter substrate-binding protein [Culicoidibacterales bacterium]
MKRVWTSIFSIIALTIIFLLTGCATTSQENTKEPITVATAVDTEGGVIGQLIVQLLEANEIPVIDQTQFAEISILRNALVSGEVDLTVDYTGSGERYFADTDSTVWSDSTAGYELIKELDLQANQLVWLTPAPANNTEAIATTKVLAEEYGLETMADFAEYVNAGNPVKFITSTIFAQGVRGLVGLEEAYNFQLTNEQMIQLQDGNTTQMLKALAEGQNEVNFSLVYATDGSLEQLDLVVLTDEKSIPPVYHPTAVIREAVLTSYPEVETILAPLFETLTLETLQQLNAKVAFDGESSQAVAQAYLSDNNFIE